MTPAPAADPSVRPLPRDGLATVVLDGEMVVYDHATRTLHHLNEHATLVWLQCDGTRTVEDIATALAEGREDAHPSILRDVVALVQRLGTAELLVH